jgi:hypothetical protein
MPLTFSDERGDRIMNTNEYSLSPSRFSRRSLLIGGGAAAFGLALPRHLQAASYPTPYQHPEWLVDASWVMQQADAIKIIAFMLIEEYEAGHIPGSAQIDSPDLTVTFTDPSSINGWQSRVENNLARLNVTPADTVVTTTAPSSGPASGGSLMPWGMLTRGFSAAVSLPGRRRKANWKPAHLR